MEKKLEIILKEYNEHVKRQLDIFQKHIDEKFDFLLKLMRSSSSKNNTRIKRP